MRFVRLHSVASLFQMRRVHCSFSARLIVSFTWSVKAPSAAVCRSRMPLVSAACLDVMLAVSVPNESMNACHAFVLQLLRDLLEVNIDLGQLLDRLARGIEVFFETGAHLAVIAERCESRGRHGVDCVRADQLFDVIHVAVIRILRAGARPQWPLHARAFGFEFGETFAREKLFEALIHQLRIRNRRFAEQRSERRFLRFIA